MGSRKRIFVGCTLAAILGVGGLFGDVRAQDQAGDNMNLDVTVRSDKSLTGPEQVDWVQKKANAARLTSERVQNMLDGARKEKDALKIDCLDDKLTQIRVNMVGIEERTEALKIAVRAGDNSTANQQFTILTIYVSKIDGLKAEAENCIGDIDVLLGQTATVVTMDDDITPSDPSESSPDTIMVLTDPNPPASGFL